MLILVPTALERAAIFPELAGMEWGVSARWMQLTSLGEPADVACCGFGLAAAGARAAALLASRSDACVLAGIAGALRPDLAPLASVVVGTHVATDGIGVGCGDGFVAASQASGPLRAAWAQQASGPAWVPPVAGIRGGVLSVAAASATPDEARRRRDLHPDCLVEEMEAEAVLQAGIAVGRRVAVVRAVSNVAGSRDHEGWRAAEALAALRGALRDWLRP